MNFLFPLYLLGAAAIAIPILLHLRRRPPKDHVAFSSLMFLEKTPERLTRRTRIERWLLLALRCLALILLAFVFGRPFLKSATILPDLGEGRRLLVLIDTSASMRRDDLWTRALSEAETILKTTDPADEVAVATFDEEFRLLRDFSSMATLPGSARADSFRQAVDEAKLSGPGWRSTRMGEALTESAERIGDAGSQKEMDEQEIVLISDFQEGADRDSLNRFAWPEEISVRPVTISVTKDPGNLALHLVAAGASDDPPSEEAGQTASNEEVRQVKRRVRLTNGRDSESETFSLAWQGAPESKVDGFLPAGASRVIPVPPRKDETSDGVLEINGDRSDFDNRVFLARAQPRPVDVLFLGRDAKSDDVGSPLFYLSRAMHRTSAIDPAVSAMGFDTLSAQPDRLKSAQVVVVRIDAGVPEEIAGSLAAFAKNGGLVVAIASEGIEGAFLEDLTGLTGLKLNEAEVRDYAMLSDLDFEHPVLTPFAQAQIRDFTKIHTWSHRTLTLPEGTEERVRTMARFDGKSPAWLDISAGEGDGGGGRIYLFLSGWEPRESQLALSSKFVPLLYAMLGQAGFSAVADPTRYVGDPIPLPVNESGAGVTLPDGSKVTPDAGATEFAGTDAPGFYTVTTRDALGQDQSRVFAINLAPGESRIEVADPLVILGEFGVPVVTETATSSATEEPGLMTDAQKRRVEAEEKEANQKLWKWFVVAALGILLIETWLAGRRFSGAAVEAPAAA